jgi:hypothetical protein
MDQRGVFVQRRPKLSQRKPQMITDGDGEGTKKKPQECQQGTCNKQ